MAYSNYLIKIGNYTIPEKFIQFDSYQVFLSTIDVDTYRDADGILHRDKVLPHKVAKVEFNTPYIYKKDFDTLMANIRSQYSDSTEKRIASVSVYIPETDAYVSNIAMYVPDITVKIYQKKSASEFIYEPVRIAFIGY